MKTLAKAEIVAEIRDRLDRLTAADDGVWGTMSAGEAVVHLREAFQMAMGSRQCEAVRMPLPGPVMKVLALRVPVRWPKGAPTVPGLERKDLLVASFAEDKQGLLRKYEEFLGAEAERPGHPMFGAMTRADWMRWGYLHTDHHLRQFGR